MSVFDGKMHHRKTVKVNYIVHERLTSARRYRELTLQEAAKELEIDYKELGRMENGHKEIPKELLFRLMKVYDFPQEFFYVEWWERV